MRQFSGLRRMLGKLSIISHNNHYAIKVVMRQSYLDCQKSLKRGISRHMLYISHLNAKYVT